MLTRYQYLLTKLAEEAENAVRQRRIELGYTENHGRESCK